MFKNEENDEKNNEKKSLDGTFQTMVLLAGVVFSVLLGLCFYQTSTLEPKYAVVDAKAVIEAKKLVLLSRLRQREHDVELIAKTVEASENIGHEMQSALARLASKYNVTILDKTALLYGEGVLDLTDVLYAEMGTSALEGIKAKESIQKELFKK